MPSYSPNDSGVCPITRMDRCSICDWCLRRVENPLRRKNLEAHFRVLHAFLHLAFTRLIERVLQGIAGAMKGTPYANRYVTNLKPRACR